jgi:uncharacterized radical SAM superfamily Fe-S cluster-containing enzyme
MVERIGPGETGGLKVRAVCSALVFREELPRLEAIPEDGVVEELYYSDYEMPEEGE